MSSNQIVSGGNQKVIETDASDVYTYLGSRKISVSPRAPYKHHNVKVSEIGIDFERKAMKHKVALRATTVFLNSEKEKVEKEKAVEALVYHSDNSVSTDTYLKNASSTPTNNHVTDPSLNFDIVKFFYDLIEKYEKIIKAMTDAKYNTALLILTLNKIFDISIQTQAVQTSLKDIDFVKGMLYRETDKLTKQKKLVRHLALENLFTLVAYPVCYHYDSFKHDKHSLENKICF